MKINVPTYLTIFRIILLPVFIVVAYIPYHWSSFAAAFIFLIAGLTDWFDGYLARRWEQTTRFGAFLDPVADKILVVIVLIILVDYYHSIWMTIPALIIVSREIVISALREWMAELGEQSKIAVSWLGKAKTMAQMLALGLLLWRYNQYVEMAGIILLYIAVGLTIGSMVQYLQLAKDRLCEEPAE